MTSFAHVDYPSQHPGVARAERAAENLKQATHGARAGASLLLAAIVAALLVVAGQVVDSWTDGHLMLAWMLMWVVAFGALALFAAPARRLAIALRIDLHRWAAARRQAREDDQLWKLAQMDSRVMADISRAMSEGASRAVRAC